ncbi:hypothetical protein [Lactococcus taiwanensis]|uniref:hypothetical protein n=1 Tax=Lactococcus taiwanensis TaxID=1151742 RepID=UPI0019661F8C|nr:hypothetical protein [Lactococcus taiwanensis]QRZ11726.1 hypothetical protein JVB21_03520 [Lactococcus taiwanensis]
MKQMSTAKKFKLITGRDLYAFQKKIEKETKSESENLTELMDFAQYGLYLAFYENDLSKAKIEFQEYQETDEFDTNGQSLKKLMERFADEIKG